MLCPSMRWRCSLKLSKRGPIFAPYKLPMSLDRKARRHKFSKSLMHPWVVMNSMPAVNTQSSHVAHVPEHRKLESPG